MGEASLNIVIGSDVKNAISGLKQTQQESQRLGSSVKETAQTFEIANTALNKSSGYMKQQATLAKQLAEAQKSVALSARDIGNASESINKLTPSLNNAYAAIRKLAYILPGIGIAGLFNAAFEGIASLLKKTSSETEAAAATLKKYNEEVAKVVATTSEEAGKVDALVSVIKKGTLSRQDTVKAIEQLQKIAPSYFGKLDAETAKVGDVTRAYNLYNNSLIQSIETQLKLKDIQDSVQKRLTFERGDTKAAGIVDNLLAQGKTLDEIGKIANDIISKQNQQTNQLLNSEKGRYATAKDLMGVEGLEYTNVLAIVNLRRKEAEILDTINAKSLIQNDGIKTKVDKVKPENDPQAIHFPFTLDQSNFSELAKQIKTVTGKLDKNAFIRLHIEGKEQLLEDAAKLAASIGEILHNVSEGGLKDLAASIGSALGNGGNVLNAAISSVLNTLGAGLKQLGEQLVVLGGFGEAAQKAIAVLLETPGLAVAVGLGAIAAGAALQSKASGLHAFATGGIVTSPMMGLVGEAGPEAIIPLSQMDKMVRNFGGGEQTIRLVGSVRVSGNDQIITFNRAKRNQSMV